MKREQAKLNEEAEPFSTEKEENTQALQIEIGGKEDDDVQQEGMFTPDFNNDKGTGDGEAEPEAQIDGVEQIDLDKKEQEEVELRSKDCITKKQQYSAEEPDIA